MQHKSFGAAYLGEVFRQSIRQDELHEAIDAAVVFVGDPGDVRLKQQHKDLESNQLTLSSNQHDFSFGQYILHLHWKQLSNRLLFAGRGGRVGGIGKEVR